MSLKIEIIITKKDTYFEAKTPLFNKTKGKGRTKTKATTEPTRHQ